MNQYRPHDYRIPRSMSEAFGPYAELEVEKEPLVIRFLNFAASLFR